MIKPKTTSLALWVMFLLPVNALFAQDFTPGIVLYNEARYDSLIERFVPEFLAGHPQEEGLARYFVAESYYNKALNAVNASRAQRWFRRAEREFGMAKQAVDLQLHYPEYTQFARYKQGWCSYRLAELSSTPEPDLQRAFQQFMDFTEETADSIKIFSRIMAMDCATRLSRMAFYRLQHVENPVSTFEEIFSHLQKAEELANAILQMKPSLSAPDRLSELQARLQWQKAVLNAFRAQCVLLMPPEVFAGLGSRWAEDRSQRAAVLSFLSKMTLPEQEKALLQYPAARTYLQLVAAWNRYFATRDAASKQQALAAVGKLQSTSLRQEAIFRRAMLEYANPDLEGHEFNEQARTHFAAVPDIAESNYWLGKFHLLIDEPEQARSYLQTYLRQVKARGRINIRRRNLLEDARYEIFLLNFENDYLHGRTTRLRQLAAELRTFAPANLHIRKLKQQLNLLVNCSLTRDTAQIWARVLQGTEREKLQQALNTIQFVLPRAAINIGPIRDKYIRLLNRLFEITRVRRSDETRFFRGIVRSLQAEIQPTPEEKRSAFEAAARTLAAIRSDFAAKEEAEYIRARCLFFAGEFGNAREIFERLVKERHSLRALFYLAEIYRSQNNHLAARRCYETIRSKLAGGRENSFWLQNALAGLEYLQQHGDASVVDALDLRAVKLQLGKEGPVLSYEQLAEERFLKQLYAQKSVQWMMRYGMPVRMVYPSIRQLPGSTLLSENHFGSFPGQLDEVRHPVFSTLALTVLVPEGVPAAPVVFVGEDQAGSKNGVFIKKHILLNSMQKITVRNDGCDAVAFLHRFGIPGIDAQVLAMNKTFAYFKVPGNAVDASFSPPLGSGRADKDYILHRLPMLNAHSELVRDFGQSFAIRDVVADPGRNRLLAVDATRNCIWLYSLDPMSKRLGRLSLPGDLKLEQPEGIALDSQGKIYLTDWGQHRVVILKPDGTLVRRFGAFGANTPDDVDRPVKLAYPTRIAVVEDTVGVAFGEQRIFRPTYIFVADFNGIHQMTTDGFFKGTVVSGNELLSRGTFYAFRISGYGPASELVLWRREHPASSGFIRFVAK